MESNMNSDLFLVLDQIERDKGIKKENLLKMIEQALVSAFRKHNNKFADVRAEINLETGAIELFVYKTVVKKVADNDKEISLDDAKAMKKNAKLGDDMEIEINTSTFGRIAAQTAKQVIIQKIRETEKENLYKEYKDKEGTIVSGYINKMIEDTAIIDLGSVEAILPVSEQIEKEKYYQGMFVKAYIMKVELNSRGPKILISRKSPNFLKKLFELEIPEIYDGTIEIKSIARDAGNRSKVAVYSKNPKVDPVGSSVGMRGARIKSIVDELSGEKIDLVLYSDNIKKYIENALKPAKVEAVYTDDERKNAEIILQDDQLSLAIGKQGCNVKLAARLTGWHLDIKSETKRKEEKEEKLDVALKELEALEGIGEKMANMLLSAGYSVEKLKLATKEDLLGLQGVGPKTADNILKAIKKHVKKNDKE
jgi:N utilization substance protein A